MNQPKAAKYKDDTSDSSKSSSDEPDVERPKVKAHAAKSKDDTSNSDESSSDESVKPEAKRAKISDEKSKFETNAAKSKDDTSDSDESSSEESGGEKTKVETNTAKSKDEELEQRSPGIPGQFVTSTPFVSTVTGVGIQNRFTNAELEILYEHRGRENQQLKGEMETMKTNYDKEMRLLRHDLAILKGDKDRLAASSDKYKEIISISINQRIRENIETLTKQLTESEGDDGEENAGVVSKRAKISLNGNIKKARSKKIEKKEIKDEKPNVERNEVVNSTFDLGAAMLRDVSDSLERHQFLAKIVQDCTNFVEKVKYQK